MYIDDETRLHHMLDAGREALSFLAGRTRAELDSDRMLYRALASCLGEIGEAASRITPEAPTPPERATLKASWVNSLTIAPLFVGLDRGYWEEQGIDLQLEQVQSAADAIAFLATGQLDASFGAIAVALYNAINQGLDVRVV